MTLPDFIRKAGRVVNSGQARVLVLTGAVDDLFPGSDGHVSLPELLQETWSVAQRIVVTYELNGPIRFLKESDRNILREAWSRWRTGLGSGDLAMQRLLKPGMETPPDFDETMSKAIGSPTTALELLRQMCLCSRSSPGTLADLVVIVEAADLILPDSPVHQMGDADRHRLHICHDWFADPGFGRAGDTVVLLSESRSGLNQRVARLPEVMEIPIPAPDLAARSQFIDELQGLGIASMTEGDRGALADRSAGLSLQALRQVILASPSVIDEEALTEAISEHFTRELGDGTVGFVRPQHTLDDVVGNTRLKAFLNETLIPRIRTGGKAALSGAAVCGPIGSGKTYVFQAMAGELGLPVLELKNLRSKWFGETDVILERLRRAITALDRVVIVVDEADTQFGGLGDNVHETERRLTGRIQQMMSDPALLGKVFWLLMTARIERLSPDLRRPGRAGDLVIPVFDPEGDDAEAFLTWTLGPGLSADEAILSRCREATEGYSAAAFAALGRELKALRALKGELTTDMVEALLGDLLPPDQSAERQVQIDQARKHCTRRSLLG